ncbi:MAG: hypothetical protein JXR63_08070 [Spirochaetales bacterium]|nr:hypothetical protein [Spirochaetales bacterium]
MGINPIDLQVNFLQMSNVVGKEQAAARHGLLVNQDIKGDELAEKTLTDDEKVKESQDSGDGATKVDEDKQEANSRQTSGHKKDESSEDHEDDEKKKKSIVKDPDLGRYIDLSG